MSVVRARSIHGWEHLGAAEIEIADGRIESIRPTVQRDPAPEFDIVAPGFIDWQVNGYEDLDLWTIASRGDDDSFDRIAREQLRSGVTTWLPTLVSAPLPDYEPALRHLARWCESSDDRVLGVHLEGPFLGDAPGAHRREAIVAADPKWFDHLPDVVRVVTLAAENPGVAEFAKALVSRFIKVSIGHSRPTREQYEVAVESGASSVTHLFNAMSGLDHRSPGLAAWALLDERTWCGLIADGVHVAPELIELAFRVAAHRITLVTDSVGWRANGTRAQLVDGAPRLADGTLAGSALSMNDAIRVCTNAGIPRSRAIDAATSNVADFLGLTDRGRIEVGFRADLVAFESSGELVGIWTRGERVH